MATKADFSEEEWKALEKGLMGAGMFVSVSEPDFTDTFGEAGALAKYVAGHREGGDSQLIRELAQVHGSPFGLMASSEKVEAETLEALRTAVVALSAKAPDDLDAYRQLVLGAAQHVAEAKGGVRQRETDAIAKIEQALGAA
jgi:hypothetical protein